MGGRRSSFGLIFVAVLLVGLGIGSIEATAEAPPSALLRTDDDDLADLPIPSFGGFYPDFKAGTLYVWTTNRSSRDAAAAQPEIDRMYPGHGLGELRVVTLDARFSFRQLRDWKQRVTTEVLGLSGVSSSTIDDFTNRIAVGVLQLDRDKPRVESKLREINVPLDAVVMKQEAPAIIESRLTATWRPLVGGIKLQVGCTLGFNAKRNGVQGFVTNSHCSSHQGQVDGDIYRQNGSDPIGSDMVGRETADPLLFTGFGCPSGRVCRFSDALFAKLDCLTPPCNVPYSQGSVALTGLNTNAWDGVSLYRIRAENVPVLNTDVAKVGMTTGRTIGRVIDVCKNQNVFLPGPVDSGITMLCQGQAQYSSSGGDSGAAVIRSEFSPSYYVSLKGLHWGAGGYFSRIDKLFAELGNLETCLPVYGC